MGPIEHAAPVTLGESDIAQAMELSQEAGWNQLPADWRLFIVHGRVFGVFDGPLLVATAAIIPYGDDFAWISMVLTRKAWRRRGLGVKLLKTCIAEIEAQGRTAFLDATPEGEPLYRSLGFGPVEGFTRWQGAGAGRSKAMSGTTDPAAIDAANVAFGGNRTPLLEDFTSRCPAARGSTPDGDAHVFGRDGRIATQIGPVIGADDAAVTALVEDVIASLAGPLFLDVADSRPHLAERLQAIGFTRQRPFLRMRKGPRATLGRASQTAVIAGPEFG